MRYFCQLCLFFTFPLPFHLIIVMTFGNGGVRLNSGGISTSGPIPGIVVNIKRVSVWFYTKDKNKKLNKWFFSSVFKGPKMYTSHPSKVKIWFDFKEVIKSFEMVVIKIYFKKI